MRNRSNTLDGIQALMFKNKVSPSEDSASRLLSMGSQNQEKNGATSSKSGELRMQKRSKSATPDNLDAFEYGKMPPLLTNGGG